MTQRQRSITLMQAAQETPALARLTELSAESVARLKAIHTLIPNTLRSSIKAGPIDGTAWCLILDNNATAAKIRQLLPSIQSFLQTRGCEVNSIRLKVQIAQDL